MQRAFLFLRLSVGECLHIEGMISRTQVMRPYKSDDLRWFM